MPKFEEFDRRSSPDAMRPMISIRTKGTFGLNRAAYECLGKPGAVKLLHATDERAIGFRPASVNSPKAYEVKENKPGSYEVAGTKFLKSYDVPYDRSRRFVGELEGKDLFIHLD